MDQSYDDVSSEEGILGAEREMAELTVGLFDLLVAKLAAHVPPNLAPDERRHLVAGLIDADPELHETAERLALLNLHARE